MSKVNLVTHHLLKDLSQHIGTADSVYLLVSFVMDSGVQLLNPFLKEAANRGADIKILTGDYLYVTQPQGLRSICILDQRIEIRLWRSNGTAFHPKAYMLHNADGGSVVYVGSSNLSKSALTNGVEWSLAVESVDPLEAAEKAHAAFMEMFYDDRTIALNPESVKQYEDEYHAYHEANPNLAQQWITAEEIGDVVVADDLFAMHGREGKEQEYAYEIVPRPAQIDALNQLALTREEGYDKALVVMATGLGKTFVSAIFARDFRRVLFIAHREELLFQAKRAFEAVMPDRACGVFYGQEKNEHADCVFASIYTLGMQRHRSRFHPHDFDLIIVDEFHHAAAKSYQNVLEYFQPRFLLGITATPDRADGRDVYALCDGNVAYKIEFIEAIQRGWLAPFQYIGVYDETDYSQIRWIGSRYDEQQLLGAQLRESTADGIFDAWQNHKQTRTIAFCSSIAQANFLAHHFNEQGTTCVSLHSRTTDLSRQEAIQRLQDGLLDVIFTVDLFNEGVDIPAVDTLLFVRPTESLTVFTQQVGRGLRLHEGKPFCTIIDLIGNYRNADTKLRVFSAAEADMKRNSVAIPLVPESCTIHLDTRVINLLEEMRKKRQPRKEALLDSYNRVKQELGRRPTYQELHFHGRIDSRAYKQEFPSYVGFLDWAGELNDHETSAYRTVSAWLKEVESTGMTKSYKMVVLLAMLEKGSKGWTRSISPAQVAPFFHHYYMEKEYRKRTDLSDKEGRRLWTFDEAKVASLIARMPMSKWAGSSKGLVTFENRQFSVGFSVGPDDELTLYDWTKQICEYRLHTYFERKGQRKGDAVFTLD